jgi:hypothetical protein
MVKGLWPPMDDPWNRRTVLSNYDTWLGQPEVLGAFAVRTEHVILGIFIA